jgi:Lytic transglycolase
VNPGLVQRQAGLAAAALLATLGVLTLAKRGEEPTPAATAPPAIQWESAVVGIVPSRAYARETSCGAELDAASIGIAHPVLPCGVDLVVAYKGKQVRAEVVDRVPIGGGRDFDVTNALADRLGFSGRHTIQWRFAG